MIISALMGTFHKNTNKKQTTTKNNNKTNKKDNTLPGVKNKQTNNYPTKQTNKQTNKQQKYLREINKIATPNAVQVFLSLQVFPFHFFNIRALASLTDTSLQPQIKDVANKRNESLSPSFMQTGTCINYYNYVPNYCSQLDLRPCAARHHVTN